MWSRVWTTLKLAYLYFQYWIVGLDDEGFQIAKGNYLVELGAYSAAAKAYQRALRDSESPYVYASLGFCYLNLGLSDRAVQSLSTAYSKNPRPDFGLYLAEAHLEAGNVEESIRLHSLLKQSASDYASDIQAQLVRLEDLLRTSARARV